MGAQCGGHSLAPHKTRIASTSRKRAASRRLARAPMSRFILALDQGTTSSRAILFDHEANAVASAQREFTQYFPHSGWVEHDALEIWDCQATVISEALAKARASLTDIAAIGIANQRETTVLWDRTTSRPLA